MFCIRGRVGQTGTRAAVGGHISLTQRTPAKKFLLQFLFYLHSHHHFFFTASTLLDPRDIKSRKRGHVQKELLWIENQNTSRGSVLSRNCLLRVCGFVFYSSLLYCESSAPLPSEPTLQKCLFCLTGWRQRREVVSAESLADVSDTICPYLTLERVFRPHAVNFRMHKKEGQTVKRSRALIINFQIFHRQIWSCKLRSRLYKFGQNFIKVMQMYIPSHPVDVTSAKGLSQRLHWRPMTPPLQGHCPVTASQVRDSEPTEKHSQGEQTSSPSGR